MRPKPLLAALVLGCGATVAATVASGISAGATFVRTVPATLVRTEPASLAERAATSTRGDANAAVDDARAKLAAKDWAGAASTIETFLEHSNGDGAAHDILAQALEQLGRFDESAQHFEAATQLYTREAKDGPARTAQTALRRVDPFAERRDAFFRKIFADLFDSGNALLDKGHTRRALDLLERIEPLARGKDAAKLAPALERARAAFKEVNLDQATQAKPEDGWPLCERESKHYKLACYLEPDVVARIGDVMDDVHAHYVDVYFEGNAVKAKAEKATIRILPSKKELLAGWDGASAPEGWWSPGTNEVFAYDTRTQSGTLDDLLETLFHEASHQFMTLAAGGASVPAWLNEGTSCFFEGTRAMADHRVLWPDAAIGRLMSLTGQLREGKKPTVLDVIAYNEPGSYAGEYYSYGWGLVYFLQEFEDPRTLEHVYRPLYQHYKTEIIQKGSNSLELFNEVFIGPKTPLGHKRFADFESDWKKWILDEVAPLFGGSPETRKLRLKRMDKYLVAASAVQKDKKARVSEAELLERALGDIEYVRTTIDGDEKPDGELIVQQADVLERLGRGAAAAPLLENVLDLADRGAFTLDETRYAALEKRLAKLDTRNAALRMARSRMTGLARSARSFLTEYKASPKCGLLRAYTFATITGTALDDEKGLLVSAKELRDKARAANLLAGTILSVDGPTERWTTIFTSPPDEFTAAPGLVTLDTVRQLAYVDPGIELRGEYEVRTRLVREGAAKLGSSWGVVVAARPTGDWFVVLLDDKGFLRTMTLTQGTNKSVERAKENTVRLEPRVAEDENPEFVAHVRLDGICEVRIGARAPVEIPLGLDASLPRNVGIFAKYARVHLEGLVVEQYP